MGETEKNISTKPHVSVKTVLKYKEKELNKCQKLDVNFNNLMVIKSIQEEIGFTGKPVLTEKIEVEAGDQPKLTIDPRQLETLEILFSANYYFDGLIKPAGTFLAAVKNATTGDVLRDIVIECRMKQHEDDDPFIVSQPLAEKLGLSKENGKISIIEVYRFTVKP